MTGFDVLIVRPPGDNHWRGLFDVAQGLDYSLKYLDRFQSVRTGGRSIVFNAHRMRDDEELPADAIIFNAEQVKDSWAHNDNGKAYLKKLRQHTVWDYSQTNIARLITLGVERVVHCRVGHYPQKLIQALSNNKGVFQGSESERLAMRIADGLAKPDVDVLFVGSMNERRAMLVYDLVAKGLRVETLFDVYGKERDAWIARSKIVLNVHYYEEPIFEIFRVSHLLANKKCVVTEDGGVDPELEAFAKDSCVYVPYAKIADECKFIIDQDFVESSAERGYRVFKKIDQVEEVRVALERSA